MVVLMNLIPLIIVAVFALWGYWGHKRSGMLPTKPIIGLTVTLVIYVTVQPSYLPKGEVRRSTVPEFEARELEVQDRNLRPMPGEERDRIRRERYKEGLLYDE